jgi:hypothetical protein
MMFKLMVFSWMHIQRDSYWTSRSARMEQLMAAIMTKSGWRTGDLLDYYFWRYDL